MADRTYVRIVDLPDGVTPIAGTEKIEAWQDGQSVQLPFSAVGGVPAAHAASHKNGGSDPVGTQTPSANAIPISSSDGNLDDWVSPGSVSVAGKLMLAANGESSASKAMASNDERVVGPFTPAAHAASHLTTDPISPASGSTNGLMSSTDKTKLDSITVANIPSAGEKEALVGSSGTPSSSNKYLTQNEKGAASGVCPLGADIKIPSSYLQSYVDDIVDAYIVGSTPFASDWLSLTEGGPALTPESGKIYIIITIGAYNYLEYRWSGTVYGEVSKSLAIGETSDTAYRGDRGKIAYDHSQLSGNPHGATQDDIGNGVTYVRTHNDYTTTEKDKLAGIASGAEVNVNADWNAVSGDAQILNKPTLLQLGETSTTAYRGDRGKTAYDHSQVTGNPHGTTMSDISGLVSALAGKLGPLTEYTGDLYASTDGIFRYTAAATNKPTASSGHLFVIAISQTYTMRIAQADDGDSLHINRGGASFGWRELTNKLIDNNFYLRAGVSITTGQVCRLGSDGYVYLADASAESTASGYLMIATGNVSSGSYINFHKANVYNTTGLTTGARYYLSETEGAMTTTPPTTASSVVRTIGFALSATQLIFTPSEEYIVLSDLPKTYKKTLSGTTPSTQNSTVNIAHGLTASKILSINAVIEYSTGSFITHEFSIGGTYIIGLAANSTNIVVYTSAANSANVLSKPIKIIIEYTD